MHDELTVLSHPARVRIAATERDAELLSVIQKRHALDDAVMAAHPPFLWRAEISNDLLDSHFTRMAESTLRNYATDAQTGVAFLKGHDRHSLPIGYSVDASYEDSGKKRVVADFYTVRGLPETDDLILRMQTGILRDVSVGFHGGQCTCDLCKRDFWECPHFPGLKYEVKEGDTVRTELATFTIEDARLSEVSGVFDGSTPGAMILKARESATDGRLSPEQVRTLETQYRVKLPASQRAFAGVDVSEMVREALVAAIEGIDNEPTGQTPRKAVVMTEEQIVKLREVLGVTTEDDMLNSAEALQRRIKELEPQAAEGVQYRADLVADALAEGVRAYGADFDSATYEATLTNAPLAAIKRMRDDWQKTGDARLPDGRKSVDNADDGKIRVESVQFVPDAAYAS